jgi:acyl-coenzyme A synthetase/AMP-(fatty) acid ligase
LDAAVKNKRSLWYLFEEQALLRKDAPCLWYRQEINDPPVELSWTQTYEKSLQWSQFLLDSGVQSGDLVSTFLQNSTDFLLNMLGSWAIGCAPSLINFHLSGDGLIHCLKVGKSKVLIVDPDEECQERIRGVQSKIEELGMKIIVLDAATKARILGLEPKRPENLFRDRVTGEFPIFLFFTSGSTGLPKARKNRLHSV